MRNSNLQCKCWKQWAKHEAVFFHKEGLTPFLTHAAQIMKLHHGCLNKTHSLHCLSLKLHPLLHCTWPTIKIKCRFPTLFINFTRLLKSVWSTQIFLFQRLNVQKLLQVNWNTYVTAPCSQPTFQPFQIKCHNVKVITAVRQEHLRARAYLRRAQMAVT